MPMINEAIFAMYEGVATAESIDGVMKLGMNHPMGPLQLADFIGLDVCLAIMRVLEGGFGSEVPAMPSAGEDGRCRLARKEKWPRLLRLLEDVTVDVTYSRSFHC